MIYKANDLQGLRLQAIDGEIGKCKDFLFDDEHWAVRYMDARAGSWLSQKRVLVSPISLGHPDWENKQLPVKLTREQIKNCPSIAEDLPVSRQYEVRYLDYYGYGYYWMGGLAWGGVPYPYELTRTPEHAGRDAVDGDEHLRSLGEVTGYDVIAGDDKIGKLDGFLVDVNSWVLRYAVVDSGKWLSHNRVVVPPFWINEISWVDHQVAVKLSRERIEQAPPYRDEEPLSREYETRYFEHFGQPPYWKD